MNKCHHLGRFTKDLEIKYVGAENTAILNFTLAVDRKFKKEGQPTADFLNFVAIGKLAEIIGKHCTKGNMVAVTSRTQTRNWEDQSGNKHFIVEFVVEEFSFAGGNKKNNDNSAQDNDSGINLEDLPFN
jgi:single-strand DNA-binding protein